MKYFLFEPKLASAIEAGTKWHTIRKRGTCETGAMISLRRWTERPYRSKQAEIKRVQCKRVRKFEITATEMRINDAALNMDAMTCLAYSDGFDSVDEMFGFFQKAYGLPFNGEIIEWERVPTK